MKSLQLIISAIERVYFNKNEIFGDFNFETSEGLNADTYQEFKNIAATMRKNPSPELQALSKLMDANSY